MTNSATVSVQEDTAPPAQDSHNTARHFSQTKVASEQTLRDNITAALDNYFQQLDGQLATDVYDMVLTEVEAPLMEAVMRYTRNNQSKASQVLGLNRGTLRKKLKQYDML
ncbi:MAG: DNA-binding transcriptional regulator Fis [Pseudomonadales bacterium]